MSLRFYFGPSGSGKSRKVYMDMIERSMNDPERNYIILVPDQFTMQTQKELCALHPYGGIINIDVLSFSRMCHRIFEELGISGRTFLDDTGKNLILRKVASDKKELLVLGRHLKRVGYIHEVKSVISEFMQYDISVNEVETLISYSKNQAAGSLSNKLNDVNILYKAFLEYLSKKYITTEESLDLLSRIISESKIISDSVVVLDGFTGFTPVQNRLIRSLMLYAKEVIVTLTVGLHINPYNIDGEHKLFYLSQKTVDTLCAIAKEAKVIRGEDIFLGNKGIPRFEASKELRHLEKSLFREEEQVYADELNDILIFEAADPVEEVQNMCVQIRELLRVKKYCYRDISVIVGDLETYGHIIGRESKRYGIPVFLDSTRGVLQNAMIGCIMGALDMIRYDFSYDSVFRFLSTGLTNLQMDESDSLFLYARALGLRGRKQYETIFTRKPRYMNEETSAESLILLNKAREKLVESVKPLLIFGTKKEYLASDLIISLYEFCRNLRLQEKMEQMETEFETKGDLSRAKEYAQVYPAVMDLFNQMHELLADEKISFKEFADILESGFSELKVGIIPQGVDQVVVGDIERTRLKQIKALFFLGVNDENIPKSAKKGGLISDIDREFLQESGLELAPTGRQQMFIQKLYLYLNMTKPSEKLFLSYSRVDGQGKSLRPSYLIHTIMGIFVKSKVLRIDEFTLGDKIASFRDSVDDFALLLGKYANSSIENNKSDAKDFFTMYKTTKHYNAVNNLDSEKTDEIHMNSIHSHLVKAAFYEYREIPLSKMAAKMIYGNVLENSVSRLEQYAACAYAHFLKYGLKLKEEEEFSFEAVDMGNIFHQVLQRFSAYLDEEGLNWFSVSSAQIDEFVVKCLKQISVEYGETILYSSERNLYLISKMERMMKRTIETLKYQLEKGAFEPNAIEVPFSMVEKFGDVSMKIRGRIDRIDTVEKDGNVFVKVIDYKSGRKKFDAASLFYGLQLQLAVYMNAAIVLENKKYHNDAGEVVPGAILYYRMSDPYVVREDAKMSDDQIKQKIQGELRMDGLVNESEEIVSMLDKSFLEQSDVIPVARKKTGGYKATSSTGTSEEFRIISDYANKKVREIAGEIMQGRMQVNPYEKGTDDSCAFCGYKSMCRFDSEVSGFEKRKLNPMTMTEAIGRMSSELSE